MEWKCLSNLWFRCVDGRHTTYMYSRDHLYGPSMHTNCAVATGVHVAQLIQMVGGPARDKVRNRAAKVFECIHAQRLFYHHAHTAHM